MGGSRPPVNAMFTLKPTPAPVPTWKREMGLLMSEFWQHIFAVLMLSQLNLDLDSVVRWQWGRFFPETRGKTKLLHSQSFMGAEDQRCLTAAHPKKSPPSTGPSWFFCIRVLHVIPFHNSFSAWFRSTFYISLQLQLGEKAYFNQSELPLCWRKTGFTETGFWLLEGHVGGRCKYIPLLACTANVPICPACNYLREGKTEK